MRLALKFAIVFVLTLAILVPLAMIRGTISERQQYRRQAVDEVTRSYAGEQGIVGPVLVVPYREQAEVEERDAQGVLRKQLREVDGQWLYFPKTLAVQGKVAPSIRKRGLHQVRVYELQGRLDAAFDVALEQQCHRDPRGRERDEDGNGCAQQQAHPQRAQLHVSMPASRYPKPRRVSMASALSLRRRRTINASIALASPASVAP